MRRGTVTSPLNFLLGDYLGSTQLATAANGQPISGAATRYQPYGAIRSGATGLPTERRFTGQLWDGNVGLYQMGARWYDPYLNRFVSADTIVPEPANPQALNRYAFVLNNPLKYTDPSGHFAVIPLLVTGAVGGLIGGGIDLGKQLIVDHKALAEVNWAEAGGATAAGFATGATLGLGTAVLGTGLGATVVSGAAAGAIGGQAGRSTENVLSGQDALADFSWGQVGTDAALGGVAGAAGYGARQIAGKAAAHFSVGTPHGTAQQSFSPEALKLRAQVAGGKEIYRGGSFGRSAAAEGQYWAPESPLNPGYAERYGVASYQTPDFVVGGHVRPGTRFITRRALPFGSNPGGALEVVTECGGVQCFSFHMPD